MSASSKALIASERVVASVAHFFLYASIAIVVAIVILVSCSVFMRYVILSPIVFTEEVVGIFSVLLVFMPLPYVAIIGRNIEVTIIVDRLRPLIQSRVKRIGLAIGACFAISFSVIAFNQALVTFNLDARSDILSLPLYPWMGMVAICMGVLAAVLTLRVLRGHERPPAGGRFCDLRVPRQRPLRPWHIRASPL